MAPHVFDQRLGSGRFPCVQFATRTSPIFSEWYSRFYENGRKTVPVDIADVLTPLGLAVWIMDDGSADYAGLTLQTHNYRCSEVNLLVQVLGEKFGLSVNSRKNKGHELIYVQASSMPALVRIVRPHLLQEFNYKLMPRGRRTP